VALSFESVYNGRSKKWIIFNNENSSHSYLSLFVWGSSQLVGHPSGGHPSAFEFSSFWAIGIA